MEDHQKQTIQLDKFILLTDNRKDRRLIRVNENKNFKWRKINIKLQQLEQFEYYEFIEVGNDKLIKVEDQFEEEEGLDEEEEEQQVLNSNNKEIYTLETAQKLNPDQINELKTTKNANEVISAIVSNNEQFEKRTAYSKEKYLAKKKKKYMFRFHAEPTNLENIQNFYFNEEPKSIGFIRWDMLAFMLLQGSPYKNVLLAEKTKGLFLGALLERNATHVTSCSDEIKNMKRYPIVDQLNLDKNKIEGKVRFTEWKTMAEEIQGKEKVAVFNNLIMAGNYDFKEIVSKLEPGLAPGCIIVLHCQNFEPLSECLNYMRSMQCFIHIKLHDMWAREYQVLKNRTHPMMYMSAHSGYILTAIKVC